MQETRWCYKCEDRPATEGTILCEFCKSNIPRIILIPDTRTHVCSECDHIIGFHANFCTSEQSTRRKRWAKMALIAVIAGVLGAVFF